MFYKLLELMIDELVKYRLGTHSDEFKRDLQNAINALKTIKKYF